MPLALRVAAELAADHPAVPLATLADELTDLRTRLDLLWAGGDRHTDVRTVFSWSRRHLDTNAARTFRLLGLHPGPGFEPYAVAALTGGTVHQARQALGVLARAYLLTTASPDRYGMHDLLRGYARELTDGLDTAEGQRAALTRLFDYYLHAAAAAMDTLFPAENHRRPRILQPATPVPPLDDPATAHDWPCHATRLAATLSRYLIDGGHFTEAMAIFSHALGAARRIGDRAAETIALNQIGGVNGEQGRLQQASDHYRQALTLFREIGDSQGEALALARLGGVDLGLGRYQHAAGDLHLRLGRYEQATGNFEQALAKSRKIGDRIAEALAHNGLGDVLFRTGDADRARAHYATALWLASVSGAPREQARARTTASPAPTRLTAIPSKPGTTGRKLSPTTLPSVPPKPTRSVSRWPQSITISGSDRKITCSRILSCRNRDGVIGVVKGVSIGGSAFTGGLFLCRKTARGSGVVSRGRR